MLRWISGWLYLSAVVVAFDGGFQKKISAEVGYFDSDNSLIQSKNPLLATLNGSIKWDISNASNHWTFQARFRPEHYGLGESTWIVNLIGNGTFRHVATTWETILNLSFRQQNYYEMPKNSYYSFFTINPGFIWQAEKKWAFELQTNYFIRTLKGMNESDFYSKNVSFKTFHHISMFGSIYAGVYAEQFGIHNLQFVPNHENGWRLGPAFGFEYTRAFTISLNYQSLARRMNNGQRNSVENHVNGVAGKNLGERWSVFAYVDYFDNQVSVDQNDSLFSDVKSLALVNFKLTYHQTSSLDWFLKINYLSNQLVNLDQTFTGANATVGIEIRK